MQQRGQLTYLSDHRKSCKRTHSRSLESAALYLIDCRFITHESMKGILKAFEPAAVIGTPFGEQSRRTLVREIHGWTCESDLRRRTQ